MTRLNLFYVLAFFPLLLVTYSYIEWLFWVVVPVYGFVLLLIKRDSLSLQRRAGGFQRVLGLFFMGGSFFVYYALAPFFESPALYGGVNYAVYLVGLFLVFFEFSALREAFASVFLMIAACSIGIVSRWLEHYFSWYIPHFVSLIVAILNVLGVGATSHSNVIVLQTAEGTLVLAFVWGCVGVSSMLTFLIILVVTLFEESVRIRTKLLWALGGVLGTFIVNVIRLVIIFVADCFYGSDIGGRMHYFIGYVLFILWLGVFFYMFSKRQVLSEKIRSIWQKLRSVIS